MKETRMPLAHAANLVANNGNTLYEVYSIVFYDFKMLGK